MLQLNLQKSDAVREDAEDELNEINKQYRAIKEAFTDRDDMLRTYKLKYEEE